MNTKEVDGRNSARLVKPVLPVSREVALVKKLPRVERKGGEHSVRTLTRLIEEHTAHAHHTARATG